MHPALQQNTFLVKEHVGMFKAANNYDIFDPQSGAKVMECREPNLGSIIKLLRFSDYKRNTAFHVEVTAPDGTPIVSVSRGWTFIRSKVMIKNGAGEPVGYFLQKLFSIGGAFTIYDMQDKEQCHLKGKWSGWDFTFMMGDVQLARVTKKWAGLGKELFTSADNYVLEIDDCVPEDNPVRQLILASVMCIDMVLKE